MIFGTGLAVALIWTNWWDAQVVASLLVADLGALVIAMYLKGD